MSYFMYNASSFGQEKVPGTAPVSVATPKGPVNVGTTGYNYCGNLAGAQQMLADLGFYTAVVDGIPGPATTAAFKAFAQRYGIAMPGGLVPNEFCEKLIAAWQLRQQTPPPTEVPPAKLQVTWPLQKFTPATPPGETLTRRPAAYQEPGALDKAKAWWSGQTTGTKVAIGIGGAATIGLILYALVGGSKPAYQPNRRRRRRYRRNLTKAEQRARKALRKKVRGRRAAAPRGKIITLKSGRRYGHLVPPKKYWLAGARRKSDYAAPEQWGYPLIFRTSTGRIKHRQTRRQIGQAKMRFGLNKRRYPMTLRRKIARNINKAAKRFGLPANVRP